MTLYPQLTAQDSAYHGLLDRGLLHLPDLLVSKADPAQMTGPDLVRRVASNMTWLESCAQGKRWGWPGPVQFSSCDNSTVWNPVKPAMVLGSWGYGEKILG